MKIQKLSLTSIWLARVSRATMNVKPQNGTTLYTFSCSGLLGGGLSTSIFTNVMSGGVRFLPWQSRVGATRENKNSLVDKKLIINWHQWQPVLFHSPQAKYLFKNLMNLQFFLQHYSYLVWNCKNCKSLQNIVRLTLYLGIRDCFFNIKFIITSFRYILSLKNLPSFKFSSNSSKPLICFYLFIVVTLKSTY